MQHDLRLCAQNVVDVDVNRVSNRDLCPKSGSVTMGVWCPRTVSLIMRPACAVLKVFFIIVPNQMGRVVRMTRAVVDPIGGGPDGAASQCCRVFCLVFYFTGLLGDVNASLKFVMPDTQGLVAGVGQRNSKHLKNACWIQARIFNHIVLCKLITLYFILRLPNYVYLFIYKYFFNI